MQDIQSSNVSAENVEKTNLASVSDGETTQHPAMSNLGTAQDSVNVSINFGDPNQILPFFLPENDVEKIKGPLEEFLKSMAKKDLGPDYTVIYLYEPSPYLISEFTLDSIYRALPEPEKKPKTLLLIISSPGGRVEPAYLISRCCRKRSQRFIVCVPRAAKSAATLLCLGADEIHMGDVSELGPIDPQLDGLPALGVKKSLEVLANLAAKEPGAAEMISNYLNRQLPISGLGYCERISESAVKYGERLLNPEGNPTYLAEAHKVAFDLVYEYTDHSFAIDADEAKRLLGNKIKVNTKEYEFANRAQRILEDIQWFAKTYSNRNFWFVGNDWASMYFSAAGR
jgi:hypothetical protein